MIFIMLKETNSYRSGHTYAIFRFSSTCANELHMCGTYVRSEILTE